MIMPVDGSIDRWSGAHCWQIRVYYEDTDAGGVVFYANYLKFMERARTEWLRTLGIEQQPLITNHDMGFVVASLDMRYHAAARLDDLLTIQTSITQVGRASLNFAQRVVVLDRVLAEGNIRVGCVRLSTMRPSALPSELQQKISQLDRN
jgi:acyl-CoA thioester hydrolase